MQGLSASCRLPVVYAVRLAGFVYRAGRQCLPDVVFGYLFRCWQSSGFALVAAPETGRFAARCAIFVGRNRLQGGGVSPRLGRLGVVAALMPMAWWAVLYRF